MVTLTRFGSEQAHSFCNKINIPDLTPIIIRAFGSFWIATWSWMGEIVLYNLASYASALEQSRGLAERGQEEEEENERHQGYILCLGYLATID